jgi:hypothetical protein
LLARLISVSWLSERFFLYVIEDGRWHRLDDVAEELGISLSRVREAADYLDNVFIEYDREKGEVRIKDWVKGFPRGEWTEPGKKSYGTVIIPKGGSIRVQDVEISNDLDLDVEVTFMVTDERLKHVSIGKLEKAEQK